MHWPTVVLNLKASVFHGISLRAQELCESQGGHPGVLSQISCMVSVDVKQHERRRKILRWCLLGCVFPPAGPWSSIIRAVSTSETPFSQRRALTLRLFYAWMGGSASLAIKGLASDGRYFAWCERKDKTDVSHEWSTKCQRMVLHWGWPVAVLVAVLQRSLTWLQVSSQMLRAVSLMLGQWRFYEQRSTSIWPNSAWTRSSKLYLLFWGTELFVCVCVCCFVEWLVNELRDKTVSVTLHPSSSVYCPTSTL